MLLADAIKKSWIVGGCKYYVGRVGDAKVGDMVGSSSTVHLEFGCSCPQLRGTSIRVR